MVTYEDASIDYFTRFRRNGQGIQGFLQHTYPKWLISVKDRYFAWVQSLYITNLLANSGLIDIEDREADVAIIGSGRLFLEKNLQRMELKQYLSIQIRI